MICSRCKKFMFSIRIVEVNYFKLTEWRRKFSRVRAQMWARKGCMSKDASLQRDIWIMTNYMWLQQFHSQCWRKVHEVERVEEKNPTYSSGDVGKNGMCGQRRLVPQRHNGRGKKVNLGKSWVVYIHEIISAKDIVTKIWNEITISRFIQALEEPTGRRWGYDWIQLEEGHFGTGPQGWTGEVRLIVVKSQKIFYPDEMNRNENVCNAKNKKNYGKFEWLNISLFFFPKK